RPAPQLVVDAAGLVALGAEHVQAAQLADLLALGPGELLVLGGQLGQALAALLGVGVEALGHQAALGQALGVATEDAVDATGGRVGGHGAPPEPARLGDDLALPDVLLRLPHLVGDAALGEYPGQLLRLLDRERADEDR